MEGGNWHQKACVYGLIAALMIMITTTCIDAYPTYEAWDMKEITEEDMNKPTHCQSDIEAETVCQRCAKSTKSIKVYPMCCDRNDNVLEWCEIYLKHGIQGSEPM
ncbi:uncharacterized protein LOC110835525 [Zootermopsis nevadensis]|uniref:Uncharacterized protein n=1 Tax=Zootermopsis nevadensis TaxID=136037 RepID=A0A067R2P2_ZOONE|nr:uncharacterized protein LOC110835525 [Zootermopsis nevadensis]KDR13282.1 hypothetical protein L798_12211 [Zootermopsis nevadensis]